MQLHLDYPGFVQRDTEVLAVAPHSAGQVGEFWRSHDLQFPGLADPAHKVAQLYGQGVELLKLGRLPALFVIGKRGIISHAQYGNSMADIPDNAGLLKLLAQFEPG